PGINHPGLFLQLTERHHMSNELTRRHLIVLAAAATAAAACPSLARAGTRESEEGPASASVDVGTVADYRADGVYDRVAKTERIVIVSDNGRLYALSS